VLLLHPLAVKVVPPANMLAVFSAGELLSVGAFVDNAGLKAAQVIVIGLAELLVIAGVMAPTAE
jgi:hypothetical protein